MDIKQVGGVLLIFGLFKKIPQLPEHSTTQMLIDTAITIAKDIKSKFYRSLLLNEYRGILTLAVIAVELANTGKDYEYILKEGINIAAKRFSNDEIYYIKALSVIARAYAKIGKFDKAINIVKDFRETYFKAEDFAYIALIMYKASDPKYEALINEALNIANNIDNRKLRLEALMYVVKTLIKMEDYNRALALLKDVQSSLIFREQDATENEIFEDIYDSTISAIVRILTKKKRFDIAFQFVEYVLIDDTRDSVFYSIATNLARSGEFDEAIKLADRIKADSSYASALSIIALALHDAKRQYDHIFKKAMDVARNIKDPEKHDLALDMIISSLCKMKKFDDALKVVKEMKKKTNYYSAIRDIIEELAEEGDFDKSLDLIKYLMYDEYYKSSALRAIATSMSKFGKFKEALKIANRIIDNSEYSLALVNIAMELAKRGLPFEKIYNKAIKIGYKCSKIDKPSCLEHLALHLVSIALKRFEPLSIWSFIEFD